MKEMVKGSQHGLDILGLWNNLEFAMGETQKEMTRIQGGNYICSVKYLNKK